MAIVSLSVRQLAEFLLRSGSIDSRFAGFDRAQEGARIHRRLQKAAGPGYAAEVPLHCSRSVCGIDYEIEGRADGIFTADDGTVTIDEIKTTAQPAETITEDGVPCHWAQGMLYAAMWAGQQGLEKLDVRLTYYQVDDEKAFYFTRHFTAAELETFFNDLLQRYAPWASRRLDWDARRTAGLCALKFPFPAYRAGQRAMAAEIYHACRDGGRVFCQAPTGIGKTMSTLFPALKAMGEGHGEKLFYLTARGTAAQAAEQALEVLHASDPALCLRSIVLTAKEKACLALNENGRPECLPERCPYADGYYDRLLAALADALDNAPQLSRSALEETARRFSVCPFELGLDLSEWCDVVIGDYNYLFDPVVRLRRFFDTHGDWIFLIDEAHNLPERARDMYSASLRKSSLLEARRALGKGRSGLKNALNRANAALLECRRVCGAAPADEAPPAPAAAQTSLFAEDAAGEVSPEQAEAAADSGAGSPLFAGQEPLLAQHSTRFYRELPESLRRALAQVAPPLEKWLEDNREGAAHETLLQFYFTLRDFLRTAEGFDGHYVLQLTADGSDLLLTLLCLDPADFLDACLQGGRTAVLFSATLTPPHYYKTVLGCGTARAVALPSPFPPQHLGLFCLSDVSTRYRDRAHSVQAVADALAGMVRAHAGNYMAFFPSYAYLQQVCTVFAEKYPEIPAAIQESGTDAAAREAFLGRFAAGGAQTLLGFCVLGGVFSEGIDLTGDRLIGCAVVGVGLPQVGPRQEMLRGYYEAQQGSGFDYAYRFPGMNKVLQAAGRVIRTPEDRGVILLIDDRFMQAQYRRLMPPHWAGLRGLHSDALAGELQNFWRDQEKF